MLTQLSEERGRSILTESWPISRDFFPLVLSITEFAQKVTDVLYPQMVPYSAQWTQSLCLGTKKKLGSPAPPTVMVASSSCLQLRWFPHSRKQCLPTSFMGGGETSGSNRGRRAILSTPPSTANPMAKNNSNRRHWMKTAVSDLVFQRQVGIKGTHDKNKINGNMIKI